MHCGKTAGSTSYSRLRMQADESGHKDANSVVPCSAAGALARSVRSKPSFSKNGAAVMVSR
jgi:hypothetical protein